MKKNHMKATNKMLRKSLFTALLLTLFLIVGIPILIVFATQGNYAVMGVGIGLTVIGFYGCPIAWVNYGSKRTLARVASAVVEEHIYTVSALASHLSLKEKTVQGQLTKCFQDKLLLGYRREGDTIVPPDEGPKVPQTFTTVCSGCGAKFTYQEDSPFCPYCGSPVIK